MSKRILYAANWKMAMPLVKGARFIAQYRAQLIQLAEQHTIVLAPSFLGLLPMAEIFNNTQVHLAGQDCSDHTIGAYTGQIAAPELATAGARYCLVGHSERRRYNGETNIIVGIKATQACAAGLTPIICIGETADQRQAGSTEQILTEQLKPIFGALKIASEAWRSSLEQKQGAPDKTPLIIAYEPIWAIGTGITPTPAELAAIFSFLHKLIQQEPHTVQLLYGGSVTSTTAPELKKIPLLDGFLIGGASLDFQEFKNIVEC